MASQWKDEEHLFERPSAALHQSRGVEVLGEIPDGGNQAIPRVQPRQPRLKPRRAQHPMGRSHDLAEIRHPHHGLFGHEAR